MTTSTFKKFEDMYRIMNIDSNNYVIMKFKFFLYYNLDLNVIKNDEDMYCFEIKQHNIDGL